MQRAARGEFVNGAEVKIVFDNGRVRYIYGNAVPLRTIRSAPANKVSLKFGKTQAVTYDTKREEMLVPN